MGSLKTTKIVTPSVQNNIVETEATKQELN